MSAQENIQQTQTALIEDFSLIEDWGDRYQQIIDMGRQLPPYPEEYRTDDFKIRGCQSQVWIHARRENGCLRFDAVSDAAIVCGLIALLLRIYDNRQPEEILAADPTFIQSLGLDSHLSPTRRNGLAAMMDVIRQTAEAAMKNMSGGPEKENI